MRKKEVGKIPTLLFISDSLLYSKDYIRQKNPKLICKVKERMSEKLTAVSKSGILKATENVIIV